MENRDVKHRGAADVIQFVTYGPRKQVEEKGKGSWGYLLNVQAQAEIQSKLNPFQVKSYHSKAVIINRYLTSCHN